MVGLLHEHKMLEVAKKSLQLDATTDVNMKSITKDDAVVVGSTTSSMRWE